MTKIQLPVVGPCKYCQHKWHPRQNKTPARCAKCKRPNWSKAK